MENGKRIDKKDLLAPAGWYYIKIINTNPKLLNRVSQNSQHIEKQTDTRVAKRSFSKLT